MKAPTPKQQAYVAKLKDRVGPERFHQACQAAFGVAGLRGERYADHNVNRRTMSILIDLLKREESTL